MKTRVKLVLPDVTVRRNPMAAQLSSPVLRNRVVPSAKVYKRKSRCRNKEMD